MAQAQLTGQSASAQPERRRVTLDEYLELLDDAGYEVIDGELIPMTPQDITSTYVAHRLFVSIIEAVKGKTLGDVLMETVFSLEVEQGSHWLIGSLVPDVAFISAEKVRQQKELFPAERAFRIAPDLAVEVVSPIDRFAAVLKKVARYLGYGVPLVWVIEPQSRTVYVYTLDQPDGRALHEADTLTGAPVLPEWSMAIRDLSGVE